jgi:hypothetical protein
MLHHSQEQAFRPVPQKFNLIVGSRGWASCPPITALLREEHDFQAMYFQAMYGLARDVDRLRGELRVVILAVRAAQKHPVQRISIYLLKQSLCWETCQNFLLAIVSID